MYCNGSDKVFTYFGSFHAKPKYREIKFPESEALPEEVEVYEQQDDGCIEACEAGMLVPDICRELSISSATFYRWRAKFGEKNTSVMT
ncbi:transposase [Rhodoferax potami]|uniref:transposase n=1 Tax=Rhodoferax potami TaxID=3068338 RepID=UPI003D324CC0